MKWGRIEDSTTKETKPQNKPKINRISQGKRARVIAGITYANAEQVKRICERKYEQIKAWCYILHDKDQTENGEPKKPHIHFVIETFNPTSCETVKKWFHNLTDEEGKPINTLCEIVRSRQGIINYLTHDNDINKHRYSTEEIGNYLDALQIAWTEERNDQDQALNIMDDLMKGTRPYEMLRRYGREWVINHNKYIDCLRDIMEDGLPDEYKKYRQTIVEHYTGYFYHK